MLDKDDRVLLFSHRGSAERGSLLSWITPGGGMRRWESVPRAAARELYEETGLRVPAKALGPTVAYTDGSADLGWARGRFRNDYLVHRIDSHTVDTSRFTELERRTIADHKWWSVAELAATDERIRPPGLADLVAQLLTGWRPAEPIRLAWEHDPKPA